MSNRVLHAVLAISLAMGVLTACGRTKKSVHGKQDSHVRKLAAQYVRASSKLGHVPRDEREFKRALAALAIPWQALEVDSVDALFISERDGLPLIVVYGALPKGTDVVVYEQTGVDGKRFVGHANGMVDEVDEHSFSSLLASRPSPP